MQSLAATDLFTIVLDVGSCAVNGAPSAAEKVVSERMVELIRQGGGRVDAVLSCPHHAEDHCTCWGSQPGFLYAAAGQLELRLEECYLLGNEPMDVVLAYRVGCRPLLILEGRAIAELYDGHQPEPRDFPIARDFGAAVEYLLAEEQSNELWGHARQFSVLAQMDEEIATVAEMPTLSPTLRLLTPVPGVKGTLLTSLPQFSRSARQWALVLVVGGGWLSLGIAYLLTDLYRVHPFPAYVWYLTLQFIPRPVRGLLFIATGVAVVGVSLRAFLRLYPANGTRKRDSHTLD
jgi:histidinol phosphatase-like enzyme